MADDESRYLDYLPAIFRDAFAGSFLRPFEQVLTGTGDPASPGLEEVLDGIVDEEGNRLLAGAERFFAPGPGGDDAERAPAELLEWLAGWVALAFGNEWNEEEKRRFLATIVPSYAKRGTKQGLREVLSAYAGEPLEAIEIVEPDGVFQLGVVSTVGQDTNLAYPPPHYFEVRMTVADTGEEDLRRRERIARMIIDQEKPAHTYYTLELETVGG